MDIIEKESIERENRINEINQTKESESWGTASKYV
jgi:hypothetical protein